MPASYVPIKGFAPDADPREPGILTDCNLVVPTLNGVEAIGSNADAGIATAASTVVAAVAIRRLDDSSRLFVGTQGTASKLYEVTTATLTDRSAAGGTYSATANAVWTFAQFKDITIASQKGEILQASHTTSASLTFKTVVGAPKAVVVESVRDFVMAFNTNDATYGNSPQRWWCCKAGDHTSWTADVATQATTGLLNDSEGPIVAAKRLGDSITVYKPNAMYLGRYVGTPQVWQFQGIEGEGLGTWGAYSVVNAGVAHFFIGKDNIYMFDGSRPVPIGTNRVAKFFFDSLDHEFGGKIVGNHDRANFRIYWYYPSISNSGTGTLDRYLCYNYRSDRWGYGVKTVQFAFEYLTPGVTYDGVGTYYATYADFPEVAYDRLFPSANTFRPAVISGNAIYLVEGTPGTSSITTGEVGVDDKITLLDRVRPRFTTAPTTGTGVHLYKEHSGASDVTAQASITMTRGAFDSVWAARWHKFKQTFTGSMEIVGIQAEYEVDSDE